MSYQTQNRLEYPTVPEEETEQTASSAGTAKTQKSGTLRILAVILVSVLCFSAGVFLRTRTNDPFRMTAEPGRLPLSEYVLRDCDTGEPVQGYRVEGFSDTYTFTFSLNHYETSRGIGIGSSWNDFVEAYGDIYVYEAESGSTLIHPDEPMTVQEFHDTYVTTGEMDPAVSELKITFMTGTDGKHLYYTDGDMLRAKNNYEHMPGVFRPVLEEDERPSRFWMDFSFVPEDGGTLDFIYSGSYPEY